jgi:hypothetical protein
MLAVTNAVTPSNQQMKLTSRLAAPAMAFHDAWCAGGAAKAPARSLFAIR